LTVNHSETTPPSAPVTTAPSIESPSASSLEPPVAVEVSPPLIAEVSRTATAAGGPSSSLLGITAPPVRTIRLPSHSPLVQISPRAPVLRSHHGIQRRFPVVPIVAIVALVRKRKGGIQRNMQGEGGGGGGGGVKKNKKN
jgi:hypothetical protein